MSTQEAIAYAQGYIDGMKHVNEEQKIMLKQFLDERIQGRKSGLSRT